MIVKPPVETMLDCLYFSTVTMATLGYGDIVPHTPIAKIATMIEIFSSFGLIVVVLARSVIGGQSTRSHP
jgi:voltage-gated potassium channel Kch